jgi:hypothetical protein
MRVLVGSTLAPYKAVGDAHVRNEDVAWLGTADRLADGCSGIDVHFGVALELDGRGLAPFSPLLDRLADLDDSQASEYDPDRARCHVWTFHVDTGVPTTYGTGERLARICTGRNLLVAMAERLDAEWILFLDSDVVPHPGLLRALFEVGWPIVGGDVPDYGLRGPAVGSVLEMDPPVTASEKWQKRWAMMGADGPYEFPVQRHWNTAGCLLVHRDVWSKVRWRTDPWAGLTDDPCYDADATALGWPTLVRKDVANGHVTPLVPVEDRGYDLEWTPPDGPTFGRVLDLAAAVTPKMAYEPPTVTDLGQDPWAAFVARNRGNDHG